MPTINALHCIAVQLFMCQNWTVFNVLLFKMPDCALEWCMATSWHRDAVCRKVSIRRSEVPCSMVTQSMQSKLSSKELCTATVQRQPSISTGTPTCSITVKVLAERTSKQYLNSHHLSKHMAWATGVAANSDCEQKWQASDNETVRFMLKFRILRIILHNC